MGNFDKPKTKEDDLAYALEMLEKSEEAMGDLRFSFASFIDSFKKYLIKAEILKE